MQLITLPIAALALVAAADAPSEPATQAVTREPPRFAPSDDRCRDVISQARQEAGKPPLLEREPASPDKPYHIYAVDRRQDGCAVMVMKGDPADIRPLPARPDGPMLLMPAGARR